MCEGGRKCVDASCELLKEPPLTPASLPANILLARIPPTLQQDRLKMSEGLNSPVLPRHPHPPSKHQIWEPLLPPSPQAPLPSDYPAVPPPVRHTRKPPRLHHYRPAGSAMATLLLPSTACAKMELVAVSISLSSLDFSGHVKFYAVRSKKRINSRTSDFRRPLVCPYRFLVNSHRSAASPVRPHAHMHEHGILTFCYISYSSTADAISVQIITLSVFLDLAFKSETMW